MRLAFEDSKKPSGAPFTIVSEGIDDFLLWQEVVHYVVATALGYSHYYIVAVIIIVLLTSILVHGRILLTSILVHGRTDRAGI